MSRVTLTTQLPAQTVADAEKLVESGQFSSMNELLEAALRVLVLKYDRNPSSLAARTLQAMKTELDALEQAQFERFVETYSSIAEHLNNDDDMLSLLTLFKVYHAPRMLLALHQAQESKLPLSPQYLEMLLEQAELSKATPDGTHLPRGRVDMRDPLMAEVATLYQKEIGNLTEKVAEQLRALVAEYPHLERWHEAFQAAAAMNKRSLRYLVGCLRQAETPKIVPKIEQKGKGKGGLSKSERHREDKRSRNKDYDAYWDAKLKAKQDDQR